MKVAVIDITNYNFVQKSLFGPPRSGPRICSKFSFCVFFLSFLLNDSMIEETSSSFRNSCREATALPPPVQGK